MERFYGHDWRNLLRHLLPLLSLAILLSQKKYRKRKGAGTRRDEMSQASLAEIFYCRVSRGFDKLVRLRFLQKDYNDAAAPPSPAPGRKIGRSYSFRSHWASLRLNVSFGCQALRLMLHSAKMHVYLFQSSNQILPAGQMLRANRTQSCFPSGYFVI